ncbi:MAG: hypothetical protein IPI64_11660 [Chloracidobacterium sp.]|nr:hypothetical protein [Chloracidobacterium sp.]
MKVFLILTFLLTVNISAQVSTDASGLIVLDKKWDTVYVPATSGLNYDPFEPGREAAQLISDRKSTVEANKINVKLGLPQVPLPSQTTRSQNQTQTRLFTAGTFYTYKIKLHNNKALAIKNVEWEYVFLDPVTNVEVGKRQFSTAKKIAPNSTKTLKVQSITPPTAKVDVNLLGKETPTSYTEKIVIKKIEYADGSIWSADPK